ncbi:hypothetical protein D3C81_2222390 [compost metagenome]
MEKFRVTDISQAFIELLRGKVVRGGFQGKPFRFGQTRHVGRGIQKLSADALLAPFLRNE